MHAPYTEREIERSQSRLAAVIGHNQPPGPLASAKEAMAELGAWLREHPVIESPAEAKDGGAYIERTRIAIAELETERTAKVAPLNKELTAINGEFRAVREPLEKTLKELRRRLTDYANAVEAARIAELQRMENERLEAERIARAAEAREQDAIAAADVGECSDVALAIDEADTAFKGFEKAARAEAVAARNVPLRLGSVMGNRSLSMRTVAIINVTDPTAAIKALGLTDNLKDALRKDALAYEKEFGELPPGITRTYERRM